MALRIYLIGLAQFLVVGAILELSHQANEAAHRAEIAELRRQGRLPPEPPMGGPLGGRPPFPPNPGDGPPHQGPPGGPPGHGPPPGGPPFSGPRRGPGPPKPPGPPLALAVVAALVVFGVGSWLTARSFAKPLASLAKTTRAFGQGDLGKRAGIVRADEIGEVAKAFDDMAERIGKLLTTERELLANVSHELRTPLARIRVALDLASEAEPKVAVESLAEIAQDLAELERIVEDVLASARLALEPSPSARGGASLALRVEAVALGDVLERSVARFRTAHPSRELVVVVASPLPVIAADPMLLRRVVDNLLDNASKYSEGGPVELRAREDAGRVIVEVEDHGVGITPEDQVRLFEPFFRVDRSRTRATGGLGLGLALARRIVEAHRGTITVESTYGKGTSVRVALPLGDPS